MFYVKPSCFGSHLYLFNPINVDDVRNKNLVKYFDKDGFELTPLEREYYRANGIKLTSYLENLAAHKPWFVMPQQHPTVFLDHSMLLERYEFKEDARQQLIDESAHHPELFKLVWTKRKWGIDFSVDYIADDWVTDVFHVEFDSRDLGQMLEAKAAVEKIVLDTDWVDAGQQIRNKRDSWQSLEGKEQQNWKARYFGFDAAEILCKTV